MYRSLMTRRVLERVTVHADMARPCPCLSYFLLDATSAPTAALPITDGDYRKSMYVFWFWSTKVEGYVKRTRAFEAY